MLSYRQFEKPPLFHQPRGLLEEELSRLNQQQTTGFINLESPIVKKETPDNRDPGPFYSLPSTSHRIPLNSVKNSQDDDRCLLTPVRVAPPVPQGPGSEDHIYSEVAS